MIAHSRTERHLGLVPFVVTACVFAVATPVARASSVVHVAPRGSDHAAGSPAHPLRTIHAALARRGVHRVVLAGGTYPQLLDARRRSRTVTVSGPSPGARRPALIHGATLAGSTHLELRAVSFDDTVLLTNDPVRPELEGGHLVLRDVRMTADAAADDSCLVLRNGVHHVLVERARITRCFDGITTPGVPSRSGHQVRALVIRDSTISRTRSDGINFAYWQRAVIRNNVLRDFHDPAGLIHNDAIQIMGGSSDIVVRDNVLRNSSTQLLFVEPTIGGPVGGLQVENNQIAIAGASAVQLNDTPGARFVGNTVTSSRYPMMLRHAAGRPPIDAAAGVIIANNVLASGLVYDHATPAVEGHNLILGAHPGATAATDLLGTVPVFRGAGQDRRLRSGSPGTTDADPSLYRWRGFVAAARNTIGYLRPGLLP